MTTASHPNVFGVRAFERLRERARQGRDYAEHVIHDRPISAELAAKSPEEVTLTFAEVDAADEILKTIVDRYNRVTNSSISYLSSYDYKKKYGNKTDGVWENISEASRLIAMWCEFALTQIVGLEEAMPSNTFVNYGEVTMRDKFVTGTAIAVGPGASVHADVIQQVSSSAGEFDVRALAEELGQLRVAMRAKATTPEEDIAVAEVARAETAAKQGDTKTTLDHLKAAGSWAFDVATKIGVDVASAAIKSAAGW